MCDEHTADENAIYLKNHNLVSRRKFGMLAGGVGASVMFASCANAKSVTEKNVMVQTPDGDADCYFAYPTTGESPAVIVWPDIIGLRPAFKAMGKRLAESGYAVLVVNPYYRKAKAPVVAAGASFGDQVVRDVIFPLAGSLSDETNVTDAKAFVKFLDAQSCVNTKKKIGTTGYCMGGSMVMRTAASLPERIGAGATFHGGGLANDSEDSPHLLVPDMKANFLFAIAENDDKKDPNAKVLLKEAFEKVEYSAEIKVFEGTMHGWCPPDSAVHNQVQADLAWGHLLTLFKESLV